MKRLLQQVVLLVALAASGAAFSADPLPRSYAATFGNVTFIVDDTTCYHVADRQLVALRSLFPGNTFSFLGNCSHSFLNVGSSYDIATNGTPSTQSVSALRELGSYPVDDLRGYTIQEILVFCAGILAFGIGFVIGK